MESRPVKASFPMQSISKISKLNENTLSCTHSKTTADHDVTDQYDG